MPSALTHTLTHGCACTEAKGGDFETPTGTFIDYTVSCWIQWNKIVPFSSQDKLTAQYENDLGLHPADRMKAQLKPCTRWPHTHKKKPSRQNQHKFTPEKQITPTEEKEKQQPCYKHLKTMGTQNCQRNTQEYIKCARRKSVQPLRTQKRWKCIWKDHNMKGSAHNGPQFCFLIVCQCIIFAVWIFSHTFSTL